MLKRVFDIFISLLLLLISAPIFLLLYIAVAYFIGFPVVFKQKRPGKGGKIFTIFKFRTMTNKTDENGQSLADEQRLTNFGKFLRSTSLDELPQLINVLKGDMSLVGPRPMMEKYLLLNKYDENKNKRHAVRPGVTGLAQVSGRNDISYSKRFELDDWYVENGSFLMDLKILFMTFIKVIKRRGSDHSLSNPVPESDKI